MEDRPHAVKTLWAKVGTTALDDPSQRSTETSNNPDVSLLASADEKTATAKVGAIWGPAVASLKLSGPVDQSVKDVPLATLDGLTNQAAADFGVTWLFWAPDVPEEEWETLCDSTKALVTVDERLKRGGAELGRTSFRDRKKFIEQLTSAPAGSTLALFREQLVVIMIKKGQLHDAKEVAANLLARSAKTIDGWDAVLEDINALLAEEKLFAHQQFPTTDAAAHQARLAMPFVTKSEVILRNRLLLEQLLDASILHRSPEDTETSHPCSLKEAPLGSALKEYLARQLASHSPLVAGLRAKAGRRKFEFLDTSTGKAAQTSKNSYSIVGSAGLLFAGRTYLGVSGTYQHGYTAGETGQFCVPTGLQGVTQCKELGAKAPALQEQAIAQGQFRRFFGEHAALAVTGSYEFKKALKGIELKLYVLQEKDKGLRGGITGGWRSDSKHVSVTAFVGQAFDVVPSL